MNRQVNAIAGRLSLRPPQRRSLELLDHITEIAPPKKDSDVAATLEAIRNEFPSVTDFERDFASLCFALATGVGKTRLMGAFISYLHLAHGLNNFFVLAPNLTIYNKLITDFTPNTPKYVFKGIAEFATDAPEIITGDTYEAKAGTLFDEFIRCKVNIFNISKINSEVRGGKSPRIKRLSQKTITVVSQSQLAIKLGLRPDQLTTSTTLAGKDGAAVFTKPGEQKVAQIAWEVIKKLENQPQTLPSVEHLKNPAIQAAIVKAVEEQYRPAQLELEGVAEKLDIANVVAKTVDQVVQDTIGIPRILVVPKGEVTSGFKPFQLKLDTLKYPAVSDELWVQHLRTHQLEVIALGRGGIEEARLEDYVVSGLVDFDDVAYDVHADLLYDLAGQVVRHFQTYLSEEETRKVLRCYQRDIARFIHAQMQEHYWEEAGGYEVKISKGFIELKPSAYTLTAEQPVADYRVSPEDRNNIAKYAFGGFKRCLYPVQKFDSDTERKLAAILERDSLKWFRPAKGQFQIFYRQGADHLEYQPDFVAETGDTIYMLEPKARNQLVDPVVLAKKESALSWCRNATDHAASCGGKPWQYVVIPHDAIAENMTLVALARQFCG